MAANVLTGLRILCSILLPGAKAVLLEGIRLGEVAEGVYFLSAAPISLAGSDGAPCRAILIDM